MSEIQRELSCFFARELAPLFLEGALDRQRHADVTLHIKTCSTCGPWFAGLKKAKQFVEDLSKIQPSTVAMELVRKDHRFISNISERVAWSRISPAARWGIQLSGVAVAVALTVYFLPWLNLARTFQNYRLNFKNKTVATAVPPKTKVEELVSEGIGDQAEKPKGPILAEPDEIIPSPRDAKKTTVTEVIANQNISATAAPPLAPVKPTAPAKTISDSARETEENEVAAAKPTDKAMNGFVWRGKIIVEALDDNTTQRITQIITDLGGEKAGQVPLGWSRGEERYYHFTLSETSYESLVQRLGVMGEVELKKERHPRVMEAGKMRIIMSVKAEQ